MELTLKERLLAELNIPADDTQKVALAENALWQAGEFIKDKRRSNIVEKRFEYIQFQIAIRLWNIRGMEGETMHSENGIVRNYLLDGVVSDLMSRVLAPAITG